MTDEAKKKDKPRVTRGRDVKKRKTYLLQVAPGVIYRMRRVDFPTLFLEGIIPTPLLSAVDRLQDVRRRYANSVQQGNLAALGNLPKEDRDHFMELMRRCAVASVIDPRMTHSKKASLADPDLVWVGGYSDVPGEEHLQFDGDTTTTDLMGVWKAVLGEADIVTLSDDEADEFRPRESPSDDPVVRDGNGLRPEAVVVVPHTGNPEDAKPPKIRMDFH